MAESLSRLRNPRRPEPKGEAEHAESVGEHEATGDHMHDAAEAMHKAEPGSKHMVMSHDGYGMKSHSVDEQGNHEEHDEDEAHDHVKRFMGTDEGEEDDNGDEQESEENQSIY